MAGLAAPGPDGETIRSPVPGVYLKCDGCGDLLRFLIRYGGRALCRECVGREAVRGRR